MEVKMNMPEPPNGYEYTGEFRRALPGERWRGEIGAGLYGVEKGSTLGEYPILRKKKKTRPPVPGDIKNTPIPCRVSHDGFEWADRYLGYVMPWNTRPYGAYADLTSARSAPHRFATYRYCTIEVDE